MMLNTRSCFTLVAFVKHLAIPWIDAQRTLMHSLVRSQPQKCLIVRTHLELLGAPGAPGSHATHGTHGDFNDKSGTHVNLIDNLSLVTVVVPLGDRKKENEEMDAKYQSMAKGIEDDDDLEIFDDNDPNYAPTVVEADSVQQNDENNV